MKLLWLIVVLAAVARAQHSGDIPPTLVWNKLKGNCPASLDWQALRGNVVVVSFTPESIFPNDIFGWNESIQRFQGEQVLFVRLVSSSEFLLDQALEQTTSRACILFDT